MNPVTLNGGEHAVMLLHGLQSSPVELLPLAKRLQQAGYTVHLPHIAGYGFTHGDTPRSVTRWQDWHAKALEEFRALKQKHKLGDEVSALTLLSTTLWYDGWAMPWYRPLRYLGYVWPIRYWYTYKEQEPFGLKNEQLRRWVAREMAHKEASMVGASRLNLPAIQEAERMIAVVKKTMPRISAPAIIIHAEEDEVASPRSAHYIARHIGSGRVETVILHNSYHMITVDNEREQVAADTIRFFGKALDAGQSSPAPLL
jgi:carboxylesterase